MLNSQTINKMRLINATSIHTSYESDHLTHLHVCRVKEHHVSHLHGSNDSSVAVSE